MSQWIGDPNDGFGGSDYELGQVGFLVEVSPQGRASRWELRSHPAHTNRSHEPRLHGWCGETNNVNVDAHGMARVTRIARNGRALVVPIVGQELTAALAECGYPELAES